MCNLAPIHTSQSLNATETAGCKRVLRAWSGVFTHIVDMLTSFRVLTDRAFTCMTERRDSFPVLDFHDEAFTTEAEKSALFLQK